LTAWWRNCSRSSNRSGRSIRPKSLRRLTLPQTWAAWPGQMPSATLWKVTWWRSSMGYREGDKLMLTIELDRCDGCGDCIEVCPEGAIQLVGGLAQINSELCTGCEACVQACPNGAIKVARPVAVREEPAVAMTERTRPSVLATLAGATLSLIGSQLLPRAADAIVNVLDRRFSGKSAGESRPAAPTTGKRGGHRHRKRGGQG